MMPNAKDLYTVIDTTWPAASETRDGPWLIRDGAGGGQRVSAALSMDSVAADDVPQAEAAMRALKQPQLFMIREGETVLDAILETAGYPVVDPVNLYAAPLSALNTDKPPRVTTFAIWEPLAIMRDIWAAGGLGPGRIAVMERADCAKTALFGRAEGRPAAAGYVGIHAGIAMVHALEVLERHRGAGLGRLMMQQAAHWARAQDAAHMAVLCTQANQAANGLYTSMGMTLVGQYHYRKKG